MGVGWLNPYDDGLATGARPAHETTGAGTDRWYSDPLQTKIHGQDLNALMGVLRATAAWAGVAPAEADDEGLVKALLAALAKHPRLNYLPNPSFEHWPNGTGPLSAIGLGPANWNLGNLGTAASSVERKPGMLNGRYCLEWNMTSGGGVSDSARLEAFPIVPGVANLAGKRVILTGTIKGEAGISQLECRIVQSFGRDGSSAVTTIMPQIPVGTTEARFEVAVDLPSISGKTIPANGGDGTGVVFVRPSTSPTGKIWLENLKFETGAWSSDFSPPTEQDERRDFGIPASRNYAQNPSFVLWQSGETSVVPSAARPHLADRWRCHRAVAGATVSRQTGFAGAFYCVRLQRNAGDTAADGIAIGQQLEQLTAMALAGKWVILSFDVRGGADLSSTNRRVEVGFASGSSGVGTFTPAAVSPSFSIGSTSFDARPLDGPHKAAAPQSGFRRMYSAPWLMPSNALAFGWSIGFVPSGTAGAADYIDVTNVKLELCGPHGRATLFQPEPVDETIAVCRRYYCKTFIAGAAPVQNAGLGSGEWRFPATRAGAAQNRLGAVRFPVSMGGVPAITFYNPSAANAQARNLTSGADCSATAAQNVSHEGFLIVATGDAAAAIGDDLAVHWVADARL